MLNKKLQGIVWKEGKHYVSQCLNVDVSSFGKTKTEALKNLREALELYFEDIAVRRVPSITHPELKEAMLSFVCTVKMVFIQQ